MSEKSSKAFMPTMTITVPIGMSPEFLINSVKMNASDLHSLLSKSLLMPKAKVAINLSENESLNTDFKVIWSKSLLSNKNVNYGVSFVRLQEKHLDIFKQVLINYYTAPLVNDIKDVRKKKLVKAFWKDYLYELLIPVSKINSMLVNGRIDKLTAYVKIKDINDAMVAKGDKLETSLDDATLIRRVKILFRSLAAPFIYQASMMNRGYNKPQGYPGDYSLIDTIYDNKPVSDGIGYCYDRYVLENEYAVAIRNRKNKMKTILVDYLNNTAIASPKVLNIACGSSRDLQELFVDEKYKPKNNPEITLIDQDQAALDFSKDVLRDSPDRIKFNFFKHNVFEYLKQSEKHARILGKHDMIYSIGLADYLPERVFKKLNTFLYGLLNEKGCLVVAHKDSKSYKPTGPDWWCDWTFYPRSKEEVVNIFKSSIPEGYKLTVEDEPSKVIFFVKIQKINS